MPHIECSGVQTRITEQSGILQGSKEAQLVSLRGQPSNSESISFLPHACPVFPVAASRGNSSGNIGGGVGACTFNSANHKTPPKLVDSNI